jgi:hypothetical protein
MRIDPEILKTYEKLASACASRRCWRAVVREDGSIGDPARRVAVDAVFDPSRSPPPSRKSSEGRRDLHADLGGDPRAPNS